MHQPRARLALTLYMLAHHHISARPTGAMDGSSSLVAALAALCLALQIGPSTVASHYNDDSDYEEVDYYRDLLPERTGGATAARFGDQRHDDFYMIGEPGTGPEERARRVIGEEDRRSADRPDTRDARRLSPAASPERIYRYTKHRIPGYDYDELEFLEARWAGHEGHGPGHGGDLVLETRRRCGERSIWTRCLCQFTCARPNTVDCYAPCASGCECREDYVYDERAGECVRPEQCQPEDDYMLYRR